MVRASQFLKNDRLPIGQPAVKQIVPRKIQAAPSFQAIFYNDV